MSNEDQRIENFPGNPQTPAGPQPVVPEGGRGIPPSPIEGGRSPRNRADLILFLGIISLFACWPVGIVAWIMGNTDLKKIRDGRMSATRLGALKTGRILGMLSTVMFVVTAVLLLLFAPRQLPDLSGTFTRTPLPPEHIAYVGDWVGDRGTIIVIRADGTGDFRTTGTTVRGAQVRINGESLSIGMFGFAKSWRIERAPSREGANWEMKLEGETFRRRAGKELIARMQPVRSGDDRK